MPVSARMILHVDPTEKARWTAEAKKAGISTAEFVRRGASRDPDLILTPEEAEGLRLAAIEVRAAAARMAQRLDNISRMTREMLDPSRDADLRAQVRAELEASGERLDLSRLRNSVR